MCNCEIPTNTSAEMSALELILFGQYVHQHQDISPGKTKFLLVLIVMYMQLLQKLIFLLLLNSLSVTRC